MQIEEVKNRLDKILLGVMTEVDESDLTEDKHIVDDFGLCSLELLELFLDIMTEYNIELGREEIAQLMNLGSLYDYIYRVGQQ